MRAFRHVVEQSEALTSYADRMRREAEVTARLRAALPQALAARTTVVDAQAPTLVVSTTGGATVSALRQRVPQLLAELRAHGMAFTEIRVRVQTPSAMAPIAGLASKQLDPTAIRSLETACAKLADGPVRAALTRLIARSRAAT